MIVSHLNAIEKVLIVQSEIAKNAGHPNLRGGPREWFIQEYLENHLPTILEMGQGEIIDADSKPSPDPDNYRPQVDLVIYRRDIPKIVYSKNNVAFLAEGVKATIEVKSKLTLKDLEQACRASKIHKALNRSTCRSQKAIISYVVAYHGPQQMSTVAKWLSDLVSTLEATPDELVEMIIVLGKGIVWRINAFPEFELKKPIPSGKHWAYFDSKDNNLYAMFTHMLTWVSSSSPTPDVSGYASHVYFQAVKLI
ncbi:MAG: DUF6602 domain-containing protein [Pseudomonadota bacterium]